MSLINVDWKCTSCNALMSDCYYNRQDLPAMETCTNCGSPAKRYYGDQKFTENRTWGEWKGTDNSWGIKDAKKIGNYAELQKRGEVE